MKLPQSWTTVTLLSKILAIILFVFLPFIGFYLGVRYQSSLIVIQQTSIPTPSVKSISNNQSSPNSLSDKRLCITGAIENTFDEKFFVGKTFMNMSMSGEWGTLKSDYRLPIEWGLDWAGPDDQRPNSGIGGWWIESNDNKLELSLNRTTISDGTYTDFSFFKYKQNTFAIPIEYTGLIFGPSKETINEFFDNVVKPCW